MDKLPVDGVVSRSERSVSFFCKQVANRLREIRVHHPASSQRAFAKFCGVPERTYKRFEQTGQTTLTTFVTILVALKRQHELVELFPRPKLSESTRELSPTGRKALSQLKSMLPTRRRGTPEDMGG